jgi:ferredoxin-like protein FixX
MKCRCGTKENAREKMFHRKGRHPRMQKEEEKRKKKEKKRQLVITCPAT